jgi:acyl carrier protein
MFSRHQILDDLLDFFNCIDSNLEINEDSELCDYGLLDSLSSVEISDYLTKKYRVSIGPYDININTLRTVNTITYLVLKYMKRETDS